MYALNLPRMFFDMSEDHAVIIDSRTGNYFLLNVLASKVFFCLTRGASPEELCGALSKVPGCPGDIRQRVDAFCARLVEEGILNTDSSEEFSGETDAGEFWFSEGAELKMDMFGDMADLIVADPIHDVDEESGWPTLREDG